MSAPHRIALAITATIAATTASLAAEPRVEPLTLDRAIELALREQPSLRQQRASVEAARARIDQTRVASRPTASVAATLGAGSSRPRVLSDGTTEAGGFFVPQLSSGLSASASWRIYDFGQQAASLRSAEADAAAVEAGGATATLDIQSSVAIAFLDAIARQRLIAVAEATVRSEEAHVDQAQKFVAAQAKDPIEVAQARSRLANARSALAQAQSNAAVALANLRAAIGWADPDITFQVDTAWPASPADAPRALGELVASARAQRPELATLDRQLAAAEANIGAAAATRRPVLSASANTQWTPDTSDPSPAPTWSAGFTLSWQLFDGGRAAADVRVARAGLASALAQRDALIVSLTTELDAARSQIIAHRANVTASTEAVDAARAQMGLAEARYTHGLGSQIELADAQTAVTTAEGNLITAQWQLGGAWALLRRALGRW